MKKKMLSVLLCSAMVVTTMAGCGNSAASEGAANASAVVEAAPEEAAVEESAADVAATETAEDGLLIYGIYKAGDQTWFINEGAAAQKTVEEAGGTFVYVDSKMNPEQYLKDIDNAIAAKADGVVTCTPDQTLSQAAYDKLAEAGIPVVAADDALEVNGEKIAPWVGIDGYTIGQTNGEWLAQYMKDNNLVSDAEAGILIMTMDTVSSCVPRTEGELDKLNELIPEFDQSKIFKADYDGTTDKGFNAASAIFTAHPEITKWVVTGANEEGTVGAVRALEGAGLDADACVMGIGGYLAPDEFEKGSCMKAATYFSDVAIGSTSVQVLMDFINNGTEMPMETAVPAEVMTPENYKDF